MRACVCLCGGEWVRGWASERAWVRACVCALPRHVYTSPKKTSKQEKRKNMQQKYLRLEACSLKIHRVFLWADLGLRKKGGKKRKEKIQKRLLAKTIKKRKECQKKKRRKSKKDKSARVHGCLGFFVLFFPVKKSTKAKTKGITDTDLSQEKTQDQRNLDFWMWFFFFSPCRRKRLPLFARSPCSLSLSLKPLLVPWADTLLSVFFFIWLVCFFSSLFGRFWRGGGWWV